MMINLNSRGVFDMINKNFKWLTYDIDSSMVLKVIYPYGEKNSELAIYNVVDVLGVTGDQLNVKTANIDDLTNLLTVGIVRFANVNNQGAILDIPFRNLYLLYENSNVLGNPTNKYLSSSSLDSFAIIDGNMQKEMVIFPVLIRDVSDDLKKVMEIAYKFGGYGMQEKFDALSKVTMINHRRLVADRGVYNNL